jgi:alpha-tubulin suppressor-like RCC1 family protein
LSWGVNSDGQLGILGSTANQNKPTAVDVSGVLKNQFVTQVTCGFDHSLALLADGSVASWGKNFNGQLGDGTYTTRAQPVLVQFTSLGVTSQISMIVAGAFHSSAFMKNGLIYTFGSNFNG